MPICLITLVDSNRQWFKACYGLDEKETGRDAAFCAHAIMPGAPNVFEVCDTFKTSALQTIHSSPARPSFATMPARRC